MTDTTERAERHIALMVDYLRGLKDDHTPDGYPAVRMSTLTECEGMLRTQAARIAELEAEIANLHTTMMAAAVEINEHWDAHCDAEGYGPTNLMHRLERGIASQYGYDAKTLQRIEAERDKLRAEVERLRKDGERLDWIESGIDDLRAVETGEDDYQWVVISHHMAKPHEREVGRGNTARNAIDRAIESAKEQSWG